jgi:predicted dehydrogenase
VPTYRSTANFLAAAKKAGAVRAVASARPCDLASPYGGIFFYGIHQVDVLVEAFGTDVSAVTVTRAPRGKDAVATLLFRSGLIATMHCLTGGQTGFQVTAFTDAGCVSAKLAPDADPYLSGIRRFCRMFQTGTEPLPHRRFLAPVVILEAMERSVRTGKTVPVVRL